MKKHIEAEISIENIDPAAAAIMLSEKLVDQRNIRDSHVARLASEMASGNWKLSPDAIVMIDGKLANGQHRMAALIKANQRADFIVMRTGDTKLFSIIDSGKPRTMGDLGKQIGIKNYNKIAAASKLILLHQGGLLSAISEQGQVLIRSDHMAFMAKNADLLEELSTKVSRWANNKKYLSEPTVIAFLFEAGQVGQAAKAEAFVKGLYGIESANGVISKFKERLIDNKLSKARLPRPYIYGLMIKTFRFYLEGKNAGCIKLVQNEAYPEFVADGSRIDK